jgi:SPP1 family predicted phage head-tail adaptor
MAARDMDQRITIQHLTRASDLAGGWTETWGNLATCWAAVRSKPAGEKMEDGRMNARTINAFTIWNDACPTVAENDRILWNDETWNIRGVYRSGTGVLTVQLDAERGVNP